MLLIFKCWAARTHRNIYKWMNELISTNKVIYLVLLTHKLDYFSTLFHNYFFVLFCFFLLQNAYVLNRHIFVSSLQKWFDLPFIFFSFDFVLTYREETSKKMNSDLIQWSFNTQFTFEFSFIENNSIQKNAE